MSHGGLNTIPPFGTQFSKKYSTTSPSDSGRSGNLYQNQVSMDQRIQPNFPAVAIRQMRINPQAFRSSPVVAKVEEEREDRLEKKKEELKHEINKQRKNKVDILMDETVDSMKDKGKIKRKDMLKALDAVSVNIV
jgi:hypothetical protein